MAGMMLVTLASGLVSAGLCWPCACCWEGREGAKATCVLRTIEEIVTYLCQYMRLAMRLAFRELMHDLLEAPALERSCRDCSTSYCTSLLCCPTSNHTIKTRWLVSYANHKLSFLNGESSDSTMSASTEERGDN